MRILFTGGSSFTGYWFVRELVRAGHDVIATFTQADSRAYQGVRRERVESLVGQCETRFGCTFGDDAFLSLIREGSEWDVFCHHAADATDYRSPDFDVVKAVERNTWRIDEVLRSLTARSCSNLIVTGSVFEPGEGAGSEGLRTFSPYGLSKAMTWQCVEFYAQRHGLRARKFVIPNPFGRYEEARFCSYLVRTWYAGESAEVRTPEYIRDNIHVSLLARSYGQFIESLPLQLAASKLNPSGYVESQGSFAERFAAELTDRLGLECGLTKIAQIDFQEPMVRINTDPAIRLVSDWSEAAAWDQLADYYRELHG